jgi:putative ABC transport system permease protein
VLSVDEIISQSLWESRFTLSLVGVFALVALLLATIGVYGVMSYRVSERRHEMGIRMALGAQSGDLMKLLMGQGLRLVLAGVGIGVIVALSLTRFIRSLLVGVTPTDPVIFAWVCLSLAGVALVAIYFSSRKVTAVDPMMALRHE